MNYDLLGERHSVPCASDCTNDDCKCICHKKFPDTSHQLVSSQYKHAKDYEGHDAPEYFHCWECGRKMESEDHFFVDDKVFCKEHFNGYILEGGKPAA